MGIVAEPLCHDQPVYISPDCKADGGPRRVGEAGHVGDARKAHQKPAAHIRRLRAHGGDEGTQFSSSQIKILGRVILFGKDNTDSDDHGQIDNDRQKHQYICRCHNFILPFIPVFVLLKKALFYTLFCILAQFRMGCNTE